MEIKKVLLPHRPTVDRIAALTILEDAVGHLLEIEFVNQTKVFTKEEFDLLTSEGVYLLGVGRGETYAELGFKSETSFMVHVLDITKDAALEKLCEIMDRNNATGFLRKQAYSINWIIRQAYRLGYDPVNVVRKTQDVVCVFLGALRVEKKEFTETPEIKAFLMNVGRQFGPFSVSRFVRDFATVTVNEHTPVMPFASWFITIHDKAKIAQEDAEARAHERFEEFRVPTRLRGFGVWTEDDSPYLASELAKQRDLVVARNANGNIVIFSRLLNLAPVGEQLADERDSDGHPIWQYDSRFNAVFNGTESVESSPTKKSKEEIIGVIQNYAMPK